MQMLELQVKEMEFLSIDVPITSVAANVSVFQGNDGTKEYHLIVSPTEYNDFKTQLNQLFTAYENALDSLGIKNDTAIFRRFFCSDLPNQSGILKAHAFSDPDNMKDPCAISWVSQAPAPPQKISLWAYHISDPNGSLDKCPEESSLKLNRGDLSHIWTTGLKSPGENSYIQTRGIFNKYNMFLKNQGMTLSDNVIRTWIFAQNIDSNYHGVVEARKEIFKKFRLTPETHYIASTGIEAGSENVATKVFMDTYAISGIRQEQIEVISALDHLSPTHVYGVTFERGVSISYRDRKHIIISGTASINHKGEILHKGNVSKQLDRTLTNIEALLNNAGATLNDMCIFIVYIRDTGDYDLALEIMRERFPEAPVKVVLGPVCRPGWLIEVEGMAIIPADNPALPKY
jgi:enamine deaminase RidA (YjgF/YER057c/UK114 family)